MPWTKINVLGLTDPYLRSKSNKRNVHIKKKKKKCHKLLKIK